MGCVCLLFNPDTVLKLKGMDFGVTHVPALHHLFTMICMQWSALHKGMLVMAGYVGD